MGKVEVAATTFEEDWIKGGGGLVRPRFAGDTSLEIGSEELDDDESGDVAPESEGKLHINASFKCDISKWSLTVHYNLNSPPTTLRH